MDIDEVGVSELFVNIMRKLRKGKEKYMGEEKGRRYAITLTLTEQAYAFYYRYILNDEDDD